MQYEIEQNRDRDREPRTDVTPHSDEDSSGSSDNEQAEVGVGGAMNDGVREDERDEEEHGEMIELVHTRHLIQVPSEKYQLGGALESPARDPDEHDFLINKQEPLSLPVISPGSMYINDNSIATTNTHHFYPKVIGR